MNITTVITDHIQQLKAHDMCPRTGFKATVRPAQLGDYRAFITVSNTFKYKDTIDMPFKIVYNVDILGHVTFRKAMISATDLRYTIAREEHIETLAAYYEI